jgi:large subunit ribosomal protein L37Ae
MSKRTAKTGITAQFGARYGVSVRSNAGKVLRKKGKKYTCPVCHYPKVSRKSTGIWVCKKCDHTFAGGAWEPFTRASDANLRIARRAASGATSADMTFIASQAALEYERQLAAGEEEE